MNKPTTNVISEEELKEKLVSIYNDLKAGMTHKEAKDVYGVNQEVVTDLKHLSEKDLNYIIEKIPEIIESIKDGEKASKISLDYACTTPTIRFIGRQIGEELNKKIKKQYDKNIEYYKRTEEMWKKYKSGVSLEDLSFLYNQGSIDNTRNILNSFQNLLNHEKAIETRDIEKRKEVISRKYGFDSDTIDYILYGNKHTEVITIEECKEKLGNLYKDITVEAKSFCYLQDNYQVTPYIVSEIRRIPKEKFDKFLQGIPYIEHRIKEGLQDKNITSKIGMEICMKIGMEIGIAARLVTYVAKNISEEYANMKSKTKTDTFKKTQNEEGVSLDEP